MGGDTRDISESDPVWLKGKGDDFFRAGDFHSASNAYAACLEASPTQPKVWANRAACQLQLGRAKACVDDCTKGLSLAVVPEEEKGDAMQVHHNQQLRLKMHVRRAAAFVQLGDYDRAAEDFRCVSAADSYRETENVLGKAPSCDHLTPLVCAFDVCHQGCIVPLGGGCGAGLGPTTSRDPG